MGDIIYGWPHCQIFMSNWNIYFNFLDSGNELSDGDEEAMETEDQEPDQDENDQPDEQKSVSVIHILAKRQKLIEENKIQIGSMATNFLENPEERMFLLDRLIR